MQVELKKIYELAEKEFDPQVNYGRLFLEAFVVLQSPKLNSEIRAN